MYMTDDRLRVEPDDDGIKRRKQDYMLLSYLEPAFEQGVAAATQDARQQLADYDVPEDVVDDALYDVMRGTRDATPEAAFVDGDRLDQDIADLADRLDADTQYTSPIRYHAHSSGRIRSESLNRATGFCIGQGRVAADRGTYALTADGKARLETMRNGEGVYERVFDGGFAETVDAFVDELYDG